MSDSDEYEPITLGFGWEFWPETDRLRWMLTHDRLLISEWRKRGGLFVYRQNLLSRLRRVGRAKA